MEMSGLIRILIADDDAVVREGLTALINRRPDMQVIAEASNGVEAVDQFFRHQPDIALIDLRMPRRSGVEAMEAIRDRFPNAGLVVLTTYDSPEDVSSALHAGARGYLLKDGPIEELLQCIRTIYRGEAFIPAPIAAKLSPRLSSTRWDRQDLEVRKLIASGKSNQEIAAILQIGEGEAAARVVAILEKLGITDRSLLRLILPREN